MKCTFSKYFILKNITSYEKIQNKANSVRTISVSFFTKIQFVGKMPGYLNFLSSNLWKTLTKLYNITVCSGHKCTDEQIKSS